MYIIEARDENGYIFTLARCRWATDARYLCACFRRVFHGVVVSRV
jgi:hypothetical protein